MVKRMAHLSFHHGLARLASAAFVLVLFLLTPAVSPVHVVPHPDETAGIALADAGATHLHRLVICYACPDNTCLGQHSVFHQGPRQPVLPGVTRAGVIEPWPVVDVSVYPPTGPPLSRLVYAIAQPRAPPR